MDFTALLKTVAPWIGTALGGPLGGMAAGALASALGLSDKSTEALKSALAGATPEQMLAIKEADNAFALQMQALGFKEVTDLEVIAAGDRADARHREIALGDFMPKVLATLFVTGWFLSQWFLFHNSIADGMREIVLRTLGTLDTSLGLILAYYFGSSSGSERKTEIIAGSAPK